MTAPHHVLLYRAGCSLGGLIIIVIVPKLTVVTMIHLVVLERLVFGDFSIICRTCVLVLAHLEQVWVALVYSFATLFILHATIGIDIWPWQLKEHPTSRFLSCSQFHAKLRSILGF